ncbi:acyl-CoA dehydrogenase [Foetidibacter luteolus]|uniref:acyl-CoA dehydrogenase n=1 Tax=Foetidibacter luteolus TaxID=2608880 RepID=UPI00129BEE7B|nr:acyl-CoA dehydrogenase [Foetidibacter luteolus]
MTTAAHPYSFIEAEQALVIQQFSAKAEKLGQLHPKQLEAIYCKNWFNLYVSAAYGGLELSLPEGLHIEEGLAYADGSTGWTATLCSGANWFAGFLQPSAATEIFADKQVCLAGSGKPSGIAKMNNGGYEVTGYWHYATGAPHATVFTANCLVEQDGLLLRDEHSQPLVRSFWFWKKEVVIHPDWNCNGLIATASHSFEVKQLQIPNDRSFTISPEHAQAGQPIYRYPFLQFAEATLAVNSSGMAMRFLDACLPVFKEKYSGKHEYLLQDINTLHKEATQQLQQARQQFYTAIEASWTAVANEEALPATLLDSVSKTSRAMAAVARTVTDELYPYGGITAATVSTEINRVWRNLHTATQHSLLLLPQA